MFSLMGASQRLGPDIFERAMEHWGQHYPQGFAYTEFDALVYSDTAVETKVVDTATPSERLKNWLQNDSSRAIEKDIVYRNTQTTESSELECEEDVLSLLRLKFEVVLM